MSFGARRFCPRIGSRVLFGTVLLLVVITYERERSSGAGIGENIQEYPDSPVDGFVASGVVR